MKTRLMAGARLLALLMLGLPRLIPHNIWRNHSMTRTSLLCCCAVLLLSACPDGGSGPMNPDAGSGDGSTEPLGMSVSGTLVDQEGSPVPNASILVLGNTTPTVSDNSGAFSLAGVKAPYDVVVFVNGSGVATVYKGLSRQAITLTLIESAAPTHTGTLEGSIFGDEAPYILTGFASPEIRTRRSSLEYSSTSSGFSYSAKVEWAGPAVTTGTLYSLQTVRSSIETVPSRYPGFGLRENVSLRAGATVSGQDVTMNPVANSTLEGRITLPSGYTLQSTEMSLALTPDSRVRLFSDSFSGTTFSYAVPVIPQASLSMLSRAVREGAVSSAFKTGLPPGTRGVTLAIQDAPHPLLPAAQAVNVTRAINFSWTAYPGGVSVLGVMKSTPTGSPYRVYIVTSEHSAMIPDLSAIGMALPGNTQFNWRVAGLAPLASVDDAVTGPRMSELIGYRTDGTQGSSEQRAFTTASSP